MEIASFNRILAAGGQGALWSASSEDLNVNLVRFDAGNGVPSHVNDEVDVLVLAVAGEGRIRVDGVEQPLSAGQACLVPKGAVRSLFSTGNSFAYVTCHRRRGGLWPR